MSKTIKSLSTKDAGKGDKPRKVNLNKYRDNYSGINWSKLSKKELADEVENNPS